ncbi:ROK family protein [candidate division GN15 bacterium]|nr:ROK family protein [candidate division GN15 bacterium]
MKNSTDKVALGGGVGRGRKARSKGNRNHAERGHSLADNVLQLIWQEHQISRAEIARRTEMSRSTVSEIVDSLLKAGLVAEVGAGPSRGGRRPIVLEFQDEARVILGVDIGATHVSVVLTDLRGRELVWREKRHPVRSDPQGTRLLVMDLCDECLVAWKRSPKRLLSIGVAVPSPVDPVNPEWLSEVVIPNWRGRSELERLHQKYDVPVYVDNDANCGALAEHWWGAGRGIEDFIYIKLGTGIGAGFVLAGELYRGVAGAAGEFGHLPIDPEGPRCVCGLNGCLATYVGASALKERAEALIDQYPDSVLRNGKPAVPAIEDAALSGDDLAVRVVSEAADHLGTAVVSWLNLMNPTMVVLGGGLSRLQDLILEPIRDKVKRCTLVDAAATARIRTSELGPRAVAVGAATLALESAFADPQLFRRKPRPEVRT